MANQVLLVCIDVDGTLVGSAGVVSPEVWAATERVRATGVSLAICSGRPALGMTREFAARLDPEGWHVFQNGASIVHLPTGQSRSRLLQVAAVELLITRSHETGRVLELYTDTEYLTERDTDYSRRHAALLGTPFELRSFADTPKGVLRAQWLMPHEQVENVISEEHAGLHLSPSIAPGMPDITFINMTAPDTDKASAVRAIAAEYGFPLEHVMMIGDGGNDVGAMRAVGYSVAMGNAEPEVHAVANYRVGHVDEGGLIEALDLVLRVN